MTENADVFSCIRNRAWFSRIASNNLKSADKTGISCVLPEVSRKYRLTQDLVVVIVIRDYRFSN
jgi:hypothetical protein